MNYSYEGNGYMKNKFKRISRSLTSLVLAVSIFCLSLPLSTQAAGFSDVPGSSWYASAVSHLVDEGIIQGTSPTTFSPNNKLTRGAFVTMLAKTALTPGDLEQYSFQGSFKDVSPKNWANKYINWAGEAGIVNGYEDNTFRPNKSVSRQEMAKMVVNFASITGKKLPAVTQAVSFSDSGKISNYAVASVRMCQQAGIINGYKDNTFRPSGTANRAEAAALYSRFLKCYETGNYDITIKRVLNTPVRAVEFDPYDYTAGLIMGKDLVDGSEAPTSMVSRTGAVIAVNAAFFDMGSYQPLGTLISQDRVVTVDNTYAPAKSAISMDSSGTFSIESFSTLHKVSLSQTGAEPIEISGVLVNRWPSTGSDATRILYTRDWGKTLCFPARDAVTLDKNGVVTAKTTYADVSIPEDGYVLAQRARRQYEGSFFDTCKVGDVVDIQRYYDGASTQDIQLSIGAGPRIVKDGKPYGNQSTYHAEGFTDPNIINYSARRVCIGIKSDGNLVILTAFTTLAQLSKLMVSLGCTDAINFDGGGSTNIYVNGSWLYGPQDRRLNNMLYFK